MVCVLPCFPLVRSSYSSCRLLLVLCFSLVDTLLRLWRVCSSPSVVNVSSSSSIDSQKSFVAVLRTPPSSSVARRWHGSESVLERLGS